MRTRWSRAVAVLLAVGATASVVACGSSDSNSTPAAGQSGSQKLEHVTLSVPAPIAVYALPYYAKDKGLFAKEGLDVDVKVVPSQQNTAALGSGTVQFSVAGAPGNDTAAIKAPIKLLGTYSTKADAQLVAQARFSDVGSLKGETIGVSAPGAFSDILARIALDRAGLPSDEVTLRPMGDLGASIAAFKSGQIDAVVMSEPTTTQLLKAVKGSKVIVDYTKAIQWTQAGVYANMDWVKDHPDATVGLLKALDAAVEDWWKDPAGAEKVLKDSDIKSQDPKYDYEHTLTIMSHQMLPIDEDTQRFVLETMKDNDMDVDPSNWQHWVDNSYLEQLQSQ